MILAIFSELGSKFEAQEAPKSRPRREKIEVQKQDVFQVEFLVVWPSFWKGFGEGFRSQNASKMQQHNFCEILKNRAPVEAKLIFSRFRGFEF